MPRYGRRRRRFSFLVGNFYLDPRTQYMITILSAVVFAGLIFTGVLVFRYADEEDLLRRGQAFIAEQKVADAARTFQLLVQKYPESYEGRLRLGQAYLELGERRRAEQEFRLAASLKTSGKVKKSGDRTSVDVDIAVSKLAIVRKEFKKAEEHLLAAHKQFKQDPEVKEALYSLYYFWGEHALQDKHQTALAIKQYEKAMLYVNEYTAEEALKDKLVDAIEGQVEHLLEKDKRVEAIGLLKKSLSYRYLPNNLIQIAEQYEKLDRLDDALAWYRKAFDANPEEIGLKLSNMLMKKGRQLLDDKKSAEAEKLFAEAKKIGQQANIPAHRLYPVDTSKVRFVAMNPDFVTGEFSPQVKVTFENQADQSLGFLVARAIFLSGDKEIARTTKVVASPEDPLLPHGNKKSKTDLNLKPSGRYSLHLLKAGELRVKIDIAYSEDEDTEWQSKAIHETRIRIPKPDDVIQGEDPGEGALEPPVPPAPSEAV